MYYFYKFLIFILSDVKGNEYLSFDCLRKCILQTVIHRVKPPYKYRCFTP